MRVESIIIRIVLSYKTNHEKPVEDDRDMGRTDYVKGNGLIGELALFNLGKVKNVIDDEAHLL